jgi:hypothetical protein
MNIEKDFVPYEQSMEFKKLGFDEPCFATYEFGKIHFNEFKNDCSYFLCLKTKVFPAPTFSQAFRWFREKYGYYPLIEMNEQFKKWLSRFCNIDGSICAIGVHSTYEEAELACLNKLIEIVKNK